MSKRYLIAYGAWLAGILTMAALALAWYRHVEEIGLRELFGRIHGDESEPIEDGADAL